MLLAETLKVIQKIHATEQISWGEMATGEI